jgi:acyl-CoA thioester hydrolase
MTEHAMFTTDINVRFRDLDAMGHVNNAVFFTYFESGRVKFFHSETSRERAPGFTFILAHISCDYLKPVFFHDRLRLEMWVSHIGKKSFNFSYRLVDRANASIVYATGESVQVCFDYQQKISRPVTGKLKAFLSPYLEPIPE